MPPIIYIPETPSTNSYLKQLLFNETLPEGTIIATHHQTAGRGQRGNSWESEAGKNLTFSMILYPTFIPVKEQFILSQIVSLAIQKILDKYTTNISIKWPNDIYCNEKKICGILIENTLSENGIENCIIGIGLNINQDKFTSNAPNPISLSQITRQEYNLQNLLAEIQEQIMSLYNSFKKGNRQHIVEAYKAKLFRKEGYHLYNDGELDFEAKIKDILSTGHLILETKEGQERIFAFKEVSYIL